jgi:cadmium resistance protein CadD (predicted permease)
MKKEPLYPNQVIPLSLTLVVCAIGMCMLFVEVYLLNTFGQSGKIILQLRWQDILVGITIYLKTSIDFAIFIGRLMAQYPGWKNRIMIEIGTALGNIAGTIAILFLWNVFREIRFLMAGMIILAGLVLVRMAEEGLEHVKDEEGKYKISFGGIEMWLEKVLRHFNRLVAPMLNRIIPKTDVSSVSNKTYWGLFILSFSVPFILGLDDFAGYIPLFNIVNVVGFATGVFLGHMLLNIALFLSPKITIHAVKNPIISLLGSLAFIGIALWGFYEAAQLIGFGPHT